MRVLAAAQRERERAKLRAHKGSEDVRAKDTDPNNTDQRLNETPCTIDIFFFECKEESESQPSSKVQVSNKKN